MPEFPLRRLRPTYANLRELMAEDAAIPEREKITREVNTRFKRHSLGSSYKVNRGIPDVESGTIMDFRDLGEYPQAYLERKRLPVPAKGIPGTLEPAFETGRLKDQIALAREGAQRGGWTWYDMNPLHKFIDENIDPAEHHLAQRFMNLSHPMSARTGVLNEIQNASAVHRLMSELGEFPTVDEFRKRRLGASSGDVGRLSMAKDILDAGGLREQLAPTYIDRAPKVNAYGLGKSGNLYLPAIDRHSLAALGLRESEGPSTKGAAGLILQELAARSRMMPAEFQASQWTGQLGRVGRSNSDPAPWPLLLDRLARKDAELKGKNPTQHLIDVLTAKDDLGVTGYAGGGSVLEKYILSRLPKQYAREELRHLQMPGNDPRDPWGGSSRDIYELGDDKLVKLAKRPRGLHEMSLEGAQGAASNLPRVHWRSPDNELAVIERMRMTDPETQGVMGPLYDRFEDMKRRTPLPPYRWHRDDRTMANLMHHRGLDAFKPFNIHAADFFGAPAYHWSMRDVPEEGPDTALLTGRRGAEKFEKHVRPTLLDPGALDYRISKPDFESTLAPSFRNVLDERLRTMMPKRFYVPPDELIDNALRKGDIRPLERMGIGRGTEGFLGSNPPFKSQPRDENLSTDEIADAIKKLMPKDPMTRDENAGTFGEPIPKFPRLSGGMARGGIAGLLRSARQRLAGGGPPRNWLRGVKGSAIDKVLEELKSKYPHNPGFDRPDALPEIKAEQVKREALKKWIDTNLANYIVKQHGTEGDPLKVQNLLPHPSAVKKIAAADVPRGGLNRGFFKNEEEYANYIKSIPWLQRMIEQDTPRANSAREYEKAVSNEDMHVQRILASGKSTLSRPEHKTVYDDLVRNAEEKYQRRNAPPINLHDLREDTWNSYYAGPMRDTLDYLAQAYRPEDLHRVSVPDAVRKSQEWHAQMAARAEKAAALKLSGENAYKKYPSGWRWIEMGGDPGKDFPTGEHPDMSIAQQVGKQLGHCYQNPQTCHDYLMQGKLYSIIDPKGKAHATIEANPPDTTLWANKAKEGRYGPEIQKAALKWQGLYAPKNTEHFNEYLRSEVPEAVKKHLSEALGDIAQIRGRQGPQGTHIGISEEALPYVQDFVRNGKWGDVNEIEHAGLRRIDSGPSGMGGSYYMTNEEAMPFARYKWDRPIEGKNKPEFIDENEYVKRRLEGSGSDTWRMKGDQGIRDFLRKKAVFDPMGGHYFEVPPDWKPQQQFAGGGQAKSKGDFFGPANFPVEGQQERLERAEIALEMLKSELAQEPNNPSLVREITRLEALIARLKGGAKDATLPGDGGSPGALAGSASEDLGEDDPLEEINSILNGNPEEPDLLEQLGGS